MYTMCPLQDETKFIHSLIARPRSGFIYTLYLGRAVCACVVLRQAVPGLVVFGMAPQLKTPAFLISDFFVHVIYTLLLIRSLLRGF